MIEFFSCLKFVFLHFALVMLHLMTNHHSKSKLYMLADASLDPGFISVGFSNQFEISEGRAANVFIALLICLQRLGTAEARLTARHVSN